jgi:hypothetical protein
MLRCTRLLSWQAWVRSLPPPPSARPPLAASPRPRPPAQARRARPAGAGAVAGVVAAGGGPAGALPGAARRRPSGSWSQSRRRPPCSCQSRRRRSSRRSSRLWSRLCRRRSSSRSSSGRPQLRARPARASPAAALRLQRRLWLGAVVRRPLRMLLALTAPARAALSSRPSDRDRCARPLEQSWRSLQRQRPGIAAAGIALWVAPGGAEHLLLLTSVAPNSTCAGGSTGGRRGYPRWRPLAALRRPGACWRVQPARVGPPRSDGQEAVRSGEARRA